MLTTQRAGQKPNTWGPADGVTGCVALRNYWIGPQLYRCFAFPNSPIRGRLHCMLCKDPHRSGGDLAAGVWPLMICLCYRSQVKTLPRTSSFSDPINHHCVLWPHPSKSCSLSASENNPEAFTELPPSGLTSLKGNSDLTPGCGCLESLLCHLLHRYEEFSFTFLWNTVACWLPLGCSWWIHKTLPHQTQLFLVHTGSLFLIAPFTAKSL